jgi:membrane-associated PAP2 superfamily phosphatase
MRQEPANMEAHARRTPAGNPGLRWLLFGLAFVLAWEASGLDLVLTRLVGSSRGFEWRDAWMASTFLHEGARTLSVVLLAVLAWDAYRPLCDGPGRSQRAYWVAVILVTALVVPALKRLSASSCPWDLAEFGGSAGAWVPHWLLGVTDGGPGHCFPSGHAVSAFSLIGTVFLWERYRPGLARGLLVGVLALGVLSIGVQFVRGAHFVSHSLWSAWICTAIAVAADRLEPIVLRRCQRRMALRV